MTAFTFRRCNGTVTSTSAWYAFDAMGDVVARVIADAAGPHGPRVWVAHEVIDGMTVPATAIEAYDRAMPEEGEGEFKAACSFRRSAAVRNFVA